MNIILLLALVLVCLSSSVQGKRFPRVSLPSTVKSISEREEFQRPAVAPIVAQEASKLEIPKAFKLLIGAGGIYAAFLYYGKLQEEVFHYKALDGSKFTQAWFLQALGNIYF